MTAGAYCESGELLYNASFCVLDSEAEFMARKAVALVLLTIILACSVFAQGNTDHAPRIATVNGEAILLKAWEEELLKLHGQKIIQQKMYDAIVTSEFQRRQEKIPNLHVPPQIVSSRIETLKLQHAARTKGQEVSWEDKLRQMGIMSEEQLRERVEIDLAVEMMMRTDLKLTDAEIITPEENEQWFRMIKQSVKVTHKHSSTVDMETRQTRDGLPSGVLAFLTWPDEQRVLITRAEVLERACEITPEGQKKAIQEGLISEEVIQRAADASGVKVTAADVIKRWKEMEQDFNLDPANAGKDFPTEMRRKGQPLVEMMGNRQTRIELLLRKLAEPEVGDDDVRKFYEMNEDILTGKSVRAAHILCATRNLRTGTARDPQDVQAAHERIQEIARKLKEGRSFEELAATYSDDPQSRSRGGEVGYVHKGMRLDPRFLEVVFSLEKGGISEPFQTGLGWHIARVLDIQVARTLDMSDPVVYGMLKRLAITRQMQVALDEEMKKAQITREALP